MGKKKTHEEFITELSKINSKIELLEEYKGSDKKILCKCLICGHKWTPIAQNLLIGKGCPICFRKRQKLTHEEFVKKVESENSFIKIIGTYHIAKEKIECECKKCGHHWFPMASDVMNGRGCPKCVKNKKKTQKEFESEVHIKNPHIQVLGKYVNRNTHIECKCLKHDYIWTTNPSTVINGVGCPLCLKENKTKKRAKTHEVFVNEVQEINSNIKILSRYVNNHTKVQCQCLIDGHLWEATPADLLRGNGCPKCKFKKLSDLYKKSHNQFVNEMQEKSPNIIILDTYQNCHTKVKCKCKRCGHIWENTPSHLLQGENCPLCQFSKGEKAVSIYFKKHKVKFHTQKMFSDLVGIGGGLLSYDFYLPQYNILCEIQGKQHEMPIEYFGGEEQFKIQQEHDRRKREYAEKNGYKLLEIWYYDYDKIEEILSRELELD